MHSREDWFATSATWWASIAAALPRPWPAEACLCDLRWWADQERRGLARRPGRSALAARWGLSEHHVRQLVDDPSWADPTRRSGLPATPPPPDRRGLRVLPGGDRQPPASGPPERRQPPASESPAAATANADNGPKITSESPADHQPPASGPPARDVPRAPVGGDAGAPARAVRDPSPRSERTPSPTPAPEGQGLDLLVGAIGSLFGETQHNAPWHARLRRREQAAVEGIRSALIRAGTWPVGARRRQLAEAIGVALDRWEAEHGGLAPGQVWVPPSAPPVADEAVVEELTAEEAAEALHALVVLGAEDAARALAAEHGLPWLAQDDGGGPDVEPEPAAWDGLDDDDRARVGAMLAAWGGRLPAYAEAFRPGAGAWPGGGAVMAGLRSVVIGAGCEARRLTEAARAAVAWLDAGHRGDAWT